MIDTSAREPGRIDLNLYGRRWYREDVGLPLAATLATCGLGRWLLPGETSGPLLLLWLAGVASITLLSAALAAPQVWKQVTQVISSRFAR